MVYERRQAPRRIVSLYCTLNRNKGGVIPGRTVDVGEGGMCVSTQRPLAIDEVLNFDLVLENGEKHGQCRVLRQVKHDTYALRFEQAA